MFFHLILPCDKNHNKIILKWAISIVFIYIRLVFSSNTFIEHFFAPNIYLPIYFYIEKCGWSIFSCILNISRWTVYKSAWTRCFKNKHAFHLSRSFFMISFIERFSKRDFEKESEKSFQNCWHKSVELWAF